MKAGRRATVGVSVKNIGQAAWPDRQTAHVSGSGAGAVRLGYRWWRVGTPPTLVADYGNGRADLAAPLAPGGATTLTIDVDPPADPGRYLLQLDLVQELITWFEARGAATLKAPVIVEQADEGAPAAGARPAGARGAPPQPSSSPSPPNPPPAVMESAPPGLNGIWALLAAAAFIAVVPLGLGYLIVGRSDRGIGAERLAWAHGIGFATLVFAVGAAATFLPARRYGPALAAASAAMLVLVRHSRVALLVDLRRGWKPIVITVAVAAAGMVVLNWPSLSAGDALFFDGHGNHDGFYNVVNARWLLDHDARAIPEWSVASPLYFSVLDLIGRQSVVTRLAAESLLAVAATTTRHDPIAIYLPLLSALLVPWLATSLLIVRTGWPGSTPPGWAAALLGLLQPVFLFFFANGNFPNLVGLLPCTLLLLLFRSQQTERWPPFGLGAIALATAASMATYPEVLAVTSVGLGILALTALGRLSATNTVRAAMAVAAGVVLNPLVALRAASGLRTALEAGPSVAGGQPWFAPLEPAQFLPAAVTLSFDAARALPVVVAFVVSVAIVVAVAVGWRRMRDPALGWAAMVSLSAVWALGWYRGMPYAYQKGVQWTAVIVSVLLAVGIVECIRSPWAATTWRARWPRLALAAAGGICAAWLAVASVQGERRMLALASVKRIDGDFRAVAAMVGRAEPGASVAIRDDSLGADGFFAMWIPYFVRANPIFFEWGEPTGNYLSALVRHSARVPLSRPGYVIAAAGTAPGPGERVVVVNRRFWFLEAGPVEHEAVLGAAARLPLRVDGAAVIARVDGGRVSPDGSFTILAYSKPAVVIEGAAFMMQPHTCPTEMYLGLADPEGNVVLTAAAERFARHGYVRTLGFPPDATCAFRARLDTARLGPGTYYFRAFQLTSDRGVYANAIGDPRLVVRP